MDLLIVKEDLARSFFYFQIDVLLRVHNFRAFAIICDEKCSARVYNAGAKCTDQVISRERRNACTQQAPAENFRVPSCIGTAIQIDRREAEVRPNVIPIRPGLP